MSVQGVDPKTNVSRGTSVAPTGGFPSTHCDLVPDSGSHGLTGFGMPKKGLIAESVAAVIAGVDVDEEQAEPVVVVPEPEPVSSPEPEPSPTSPASEPTPEPTPTTE